ncbi:hypothetical protein KU15F69_18830 [Escherichia coli]
MKPSYEELEQKLIESERCGRQADITIENLERKVEHLAAENAALKSAHPQPFGREMMKALDAYEKHQDETPETGMLDAFFVLRDSIRVDTTATDAFLAEVRASELDSLAGVAETMMVKFANQGASEIPESKGWEMIYRQAS